MPGVSRATVGSPSQLRGATERQGRQQLLRVVLDRRDAVPGEQVREQPHHHLAAFQHVGDAGRRAGVVLQHVEVVRPDADDVDAGDMGVDAAGRVQPLHLRQVAGIVQHQPLRHLAGAQDLLVVIDVVQEGVERLHPLRQPLLEMPPFGGVEHAGHDVERDQPLGIAALAIDREGDADAAEQRRRLPALEIEDRSRRRRQPICQGRIGGSDRIPAHLVECLHHPSGTSLLDQNIKQGMCHRPQAKFCGGRRRMPKIPARPAGPIGAGVNRRRR